MRFPLPALVMFLMGASTAAQAPTEPQCGVCHGKKATSHSQSVHVRGGVTCVGCHGGDPWTNDSGRAHEGLTSFEDRIEAVELCADCHSDPDRMRRHGLRTDQLAHYKTSQHGRRLFGAADENVATCVDCHGACDVRESDHSQSPVNKLNQVATCGRCHADTLLMDRYDLSASPVANYADSIHGEALLNDRSMASPACTDCHGSHGALPPRVEEVATVCGDCHRGIYASFLESPHARVAEYGGMEECTSCHGNHAVVRPGTQMFVGDGAGHCGSCHEGEYDEGAKAAAAIHDIMSQLGTRVQETAVALDSAAAEGLFIEDESGYLDEARSLLAQARPLTHTASVELLGDLRNRGIAMIDKTEESLAMKRRWLRDRRIFTSTFFGVIAAFALVLWARARRWMA